MAESSKKLPEDVVEYFLFPVVPRGLTEVETVIFLEAECDRYVAQLSSFLVNYIWQSEPFILQPKAASGDVPAHLYGKTHFGDNVEDEWFIVYMLIDLSKAFPCLVIRLEDSDGEFLLIEAADALPKWLNPETAENRIYIYQGVIHTIPIPQSPAEVTNLPLFTPSVEDGIKCVQEHSSLTKASEKVNNKVLQRIQGFPLKIRENIHHTHCYVPAALAAILQANPRLVAPAVQAFYYRDPLDLKACRTMQYFRPGTRVMAEVRLTRCLYAQLMQQKFTPDRRSGWVLPASSTPQYKAHDLGIKLAHGFEILCSKCSVRKSSSDRSVSETDIRWCRYVKALQERGYFRGEIKGSRLYKQLLDDAKRYYEENILTRNGFVWSPGEEILQLYDTISYDIESMRSDETNLPSPDDDSWLDVSPEEFETLLQKTAGVSISDQPKSNLSNLANNMKDFVDKVSSHEGAEFPGTMDDDDDDEPQEIQFDSTGFIHAMQQMFEFKDEHSDSSSDMSEYGWESSDSDELGSPLPRKSNKKLVKPSLPPKPPSRGSKTSQLTNGNAPSSKAKKPEKDTRTMDEYMSQMDRELAQTEMAKSFVRAKAKKQNANGTGSSSANHRDINDEDDDFRPVNIDMNTVENMLASYKAQQGLPGPSSNLLNNLGVKADKKSVNPSKSKK